jgi:hypothetical protein
MSTYEAPSAARISYGEPGRKIVAARLGAAGALIVVGAVVAIVATREDAAPRERADARPAVACGSPDCIAPGQFITTTDARALKLRLGNHALVVDVGNTNVAAFGSDLKAPFVESDGPAGKTFYTDFARKVDEALRAAGMGHDEPVILLAPSLEHSRLAALLLQEHGYRGVLIVRE